MILPYYVDYVLNTLHNQQYEAYVVGGCVRDLLLGKTPHDYDICTDAQPYQIIQLFEKTIPTGLEHGTVTVMIDGNSVEVTTYRVDGKYTDGRRPDKVEFSTSLKEDLSRRDFTINAMAYNHKDGLIDYFNGHEDLLVNRIIKCVGKAEDRIQEDFLRGLRAIRFSCQLKFSIEPQTLVTIMRYGKLLSNISQERITSEFNKIIQHDVYRGVNILASTGLLKIMIPELFNCIQEEQNNPYHIYDVFRHSVFSARFLEDLDLRLVMLLHDIGKPLCKTVDENGIHHFYGHNTISQDLAFDILKRMRYDNDTIEKVTKLIFYHDYPIEPTKKSVKRLLNKLNDSDIFTSLLLVKVADVSAQNPKYRQERVDIISQVYNIFIDIMAKQECFSRNDLKLNGTDLINMGLTEGKIIGIVLDELVEYVLEYPEFNTKQALENQAREIILKVEI